VVGDLFCALVAMFGAVAGIATTYDGPGEFTRSGDVFDVDSMTCAVDDSVWNDLAGSMLLVVSDDGWGVFLVNDSGYLDEAGVFYRSDCSKYFIRSGPHATGPPLKVVVDIPVGAFHRVFGDGDTRMVLIWRL
jgi:hypothetical protein